MPISRPIFSTSSSHNSTGLKALTATSWSRYDPRKTVADAPAPRTAPSTTLPSEFIKDLRRRLDDRLQLRRRHVKIHLRARPQREVPAAPRNSSTSRDSASPARAPPVAVARPSSESRLCFPRPRQWYRRRACPRGDGDERREEELPRRRRRRRRGHGGRTCSERRADCGGPSSARPPGRTASAAPTPPRAVRPRPQAHARRHAARQDEQRGREGREAAGSRRATALAATLEDSVEPVLPGPGPELNNERQRGDAPCPPPEGARTVTASCATTAGTRAASATPTPAAASAQAQAPQAPISVARNKQQRQAAKPPPPRRGRSTCPRVQRPPRRQDANRRARAESPESCSDAYERPPATRRRPASWSQKAATLVMTRSSADGIHFTLITCRSLLFPCCTVPFVGHCFSSHGRTRWNAARCCLDLMCPR